MAEIRYVAESNTKAALTPTEATSSPPKAGPSDRYAKGATYDGVRLRQITLCHDAVERGPHSWGEEGLAKPIRKART